LTPPELQAKSIVMMTSLAFVAAGGAIGSVVRYMVSQLTGYPFGTLAVNVVGSFAIGIAFMVLAARGPGYLFFVTGVLGGFTTFSAFSLESVRMIENGQFAAAAGYATASVMLSLLACMGGLALARNLL
jgi:fluoride exporter